jgi:hypothetical protein
MSIQFFRKTGVSMLLLAVLGACAAPPADAPAETNPPSAALEATVKPQATSAPTLPAEPSPTLKASSAQTQTGDCSSIPLGESLPIMIYTKGNQLTPIDPQNGLPVCGYNPISFRGYFQFAFSPDQKYLAITDEDDGAAADTQLHLIDLRSWQAITRTLPVSGWANSLVFNPIGTQVAIISFLDSSQPRWGLEVIDLKSQAVVKRKDFGFSPSLVQYTPGGNQLVLLGGVQNAQSDAIPVAHLLVLETQDYETAWETQFPEVLDGMRLPDGSGSDPIFDQWGPAAALSQDGRSLFILQADGASLTTVNLENHQFGTQNVSRKISWLERLIGLGAQVAYAKGFNGTTRQGVLSSSGLFYVTGVTNTTEKDANGGWTFSSTPLGLQVIDVKTGVILGQLDTEATQIALSPDESRIYLQGWKEDQPWTEVVSTDGLKLIRRLNGEILSPVKLLNGTTTLISSQPVSGGVSLGIVNPGTFERSSTWKLNSWQIRSDPVWLSP